MTEGDGVVREVVHDLVKEFLRETWGSGDTGRGFGSESMRL
jgi:hypothetical protein